MHQHVKSVRVGDLSKAARVKLGVVGMPDHELVAVAAEEKTEPPKAKPKE